MAAISSFGGQRDSTHSIRTTPQLWAAAKRRADSEGIKMNSLLNEILEGYAQHKINLPTVTKVYMTPVAPKKND